MQIELKCLILFLLLFLLACNQSGGSSPSNSDKTVCSNLGNCKVTLAWDAVTSYTDGSPIQEEVGYEIFWGTESKNYKYSLDVGTNTQGTVTGLIPGTYYFSVVGYLVSNRLKSDYSNEVGWTGAFFSAKVIVSPEGNKLSLYKQP